MIQMKRDVEAQQSLNTLLRYFPQHVDGHMELARLLATTQNPDERNPARGIELAERACELTSHRAAAPLRLLAASYAGDGRHDEAIQTAEQSLEIARRTNAESLAAEIEIELAEYRARDAND